MRNSPESPKGTGRAGDPAAGAGIPLQFPLKVWQPVDRTTAEQIPPLQAVEGPQRNIFIPKDCSQWKGPMLEPGKGMRRKELGTGL